MEMFALRGDADKKGDTQRPNGWDRALRCDECGAWRINGKHGSIHTWGDGKTRVLWVGCHSERQWSADKRRLDFCTVTQDGDAEGCLRLHPLPTAEQAEIIRDVLGIRKRTEFAPGERERRRTLMKRLVEVPGYAHVRHELVVLEPIAGDADETDHRRSACIRNMLRS